MNWTVLSYCIYINLAGLLDGIGTSKRGTKRKADSETSKPTKYRIAQTDETEETEEDASDSEGDDDDEESEFEGFSDIPEPPVKESPYLPAPTGKYVPPAARKANPPSLPAQQEDPRLKKQIQGILNRYTVSLSSNIVCPNQICLQS
jgi:hypothetical protein